MKSWSWVVLLTLVVAIKIVSFYPDFVENQYTYGIYPILTSLQRFLFGWIPFSVGDLLYGFIIFVIIFKIVQVIIAVFRRTISWRFVRTGVKQLIFFLLLVFVLFYVLWGLNYDRRGIAHQLKLESRPYKLEDLDTVARLLQQKVNGCAEKFNPAQRDSLEKKRNLFRESQQAYDYTKLRYPWLSYKPRSLKPSLFSYAGNILGFQGYYNPFSGEAQVNTTVPVVMQPFIACHEIAHQLGYAKENEANFVAYLACKEYPDNAFQYSVYFEMYYYTLNEIARLDTARVRTLQETLHPLAKQDAAELRAFFSKYKNPIEPIVSHFYNYFLQANNQPEGKRSYNRVVVWLIAYYRKFREM